MLDRLAVAVSCVRVIHGDGFVEVRAGADLGNHVIRAGDLFQDALDLAPVQRIAGDRLHGAQVHNLHRVVSGDEDVIDLHAGQVGQHGYDRIRVRQVRPPIINRISDPHPVSPSCGTSERPRGAMCAHPNARGCRPR